MHVHTYLGTKIEMHVLIINSIIPSPLTLIDFNQIIILRRYTIFSSHSLQYN